MNWPWVALLLLEIAVIVFVGVVWLVAEAGGGSFWDILVDAGVVFMTLFVWLLVLVAVVAFIGGLVYTFGKAVGVIP